MSAAQIQAATASLSVSGLSSGGLVVAGAPWGVIAIVAVLSPLLLRAPAVLHAVGEVVRELSQAKMRRAAAKQIEKMTLTPHDFAALLDASMDRPTGPTATGRIPPEDGAEPPPAVPPPQEDGRPRAE